MACNDLGVSHTMLNKRNRHKSYFKRQPDYLAGRGVGGGVMLMMERGHSRDSCGASNVPFLDLDGGYVVGSILDNSSTHTLRICVLCMPYYRKKFFF